MLQYELTGVWFILTVIYIDVEFISLETKEKGKNLPQSKPVEIFQNKMLKLTQVTKQWPTSSGSCS